jgi:NADH:ubiquinone oxidoreductase subunit 5 (subunit L)/multisubunit Na+/H+ antiporter MnhA subunit
MAIGMLVWGLLLLPPVALLIIILLAAISRKPTPSIKIPEFRAPEKYEWEHMLPPKEPKSSNTARPAIVIGILVIIIIAAGIFAVKPGLIGGNETAEPQESAFANLRLLPQPSESSGELPNVIDLTKRVISLAKQYMNYLIIAIAVLVIVLIAGMMMVKKRTSKPVANGKKPAEKIANKENRNWLPIIIPAVILLVIIIAAAAAYLLREKIRSVLPTAQTSALSVIGKAIAFAADYRMFLVAGLVIVLLAITAMTRLRNRSEE